MYRPAAFREDRREVLHEVIRRYSFGTLVSTLDGEMFATHLPFLLDAERGEHGTLLAHMARANPHWRGFAGGAGDSGGGAGTDAAQALVLFQGPHCYISPSWYATEVAVPTWNYVAVHAYGPVRIVDDPEVVRRVLRDTVNVHEATFDRPWTMDGLSDEYVNHMAANVVAFEISIARLEGKRKLNQNRSVADRESVVAALRGQGDPTGMEVADLMAAGLRAERHT